MQKSVAVAPIVVVVIILGAIVSPDRARAEPPRRTCRAAGFEIAAEGDLKGFALELTPARVAEGLEIVTIRLTSPAPQPPPRFTLKWSLPSHDVVGQWATGRQMNKMIHPDWSGGRLTASMFAREAPVSCLFGSDDGNVLTFAVSDALDTVLIGSGIREEDGLIYNDVTFFSEPHPSLAQYDVAMRIDRRAIPYWTALKEVGEWWARQPGYEPARVPEPARQPVYSTWYSYHQSVDAAALLKEVAIAKRMGFDSIIVDDGWQTLDSARGYAYTGDWQPERMPDMKGFVDACHALGVKVVLWYAVPFVGKNAKAAGRFKGRSLRYEDRLGAYVLDPRYREVREYLIEIYRRAIRDWGIDGFKLDFIERFAADDKTVLEAAAGRDFASVNEATNRMMTDIMAELKKVKPGNRGPLRRGLREARCPVAGEDRCGQREELRDGGARRRPGPGVLSLHGPGLSGTGRRLGSDETGQGRSRLHGSGLGAAVAGARPVGSTVRGQRREGLAQLRVARTGELAHDRAVLQEDQVGPQPDPERAAQRAPRSVLDLHVSHLGVLAQHRRDAGRGRAADPAPARAELEQHEAGRAVDLLARRRLLHRQVLGAHDRRSWASYLTSKSGGMVFSSSIQNLECPRSVSDT